MSKFVEEQTIVLPFGVGVRELGALWDCRTSSYANYNLFPPLTTENINFHEINIGEYRLRRFRTTSDKV